MMDGVIFNLLLVSNSDAVHLPGFFGDFFGLNYLTKDTFRIQYEGLLALM